MADVPVVLVHGFASSYDHGWVRHGWPDLLSDAGRQVVGVDLLGHGTSERPRDPAAYDDLERHALAQMPSGPVDIVGFSLGAITTLRLAAAEPERFRRIAILGIGDGVLVPGDPARLIEALASDVPPDPADNRGSVFRRLADQEGNDRHSLVALLSRPQAPIDAVDLSRIASPVLVVIGDRDPAYPADRLAASFPDARLEVIPSIDHFATPGDFTVIEKTLAFLGA